MPSPTSWYRKVADRMVRQNLSFKQACGEEDISLDNYVRVHDSKGFQDALWDARMAFYTELGSLPGRTKSAALGMMTLAIENLARMGEWEKVVEGVLKLAKVEGWVGGDSSVQVFANLTAKDIEEAKKRITHQLESRTPEPTQSPLPN